jgi:hypothetical protein
LQSLLFHGGSGEPADVYRARFIFSLVAGVDEGHFLTDAIE